MGTTNAKGAELKSALRGADQVGISRNLDAGEGDPHVSAVVVALIRAKRED